MIPLFGFLEHDTLGLLIMAYPSDTVLQLIEKLQISAAVRVNPRPNMKLIYKNNIIAPKLTVNELNLQPLDHFFVIEGSDVNV